MEKFSCEEKRYIACRKDCITNLYNTTAKIVNGEVTASYYDSQREYNQCMTKCHLSNVRVHLKPVK